MSKRLAGAAVVRMATVGAVTLALAAGPPYRRRPLPLLPGSPRFGAAPTPATDVDTGAYDNASMSIEVVLAPSHSAQLKTLLADLYNPKAQATGTG